MPKLNIVYDSKAEKQFQELGAAMQAQIRHDLEQNMPVYENNGKSGLRGMGNMYTGAFWRFYSEPYSILIRVEHFKQRVLVMDISRQRSA